MTVSINTGKPSNKSLAADDFQKAMTPEFRELIRSVNTYERRLVVEVSNDPTLWKFWGFIQKDPEYAGLDFESLNLIFDAAVNYGRRQYVVNDILAWIGVGQDAIIADRPIRRGQCFIKIYGAELLPYQQTKLVTPEVARAASDTTVVNHYYYTTVVQDHDFSIGFGLESVLVHSGEPIVVPAFTAEYNRNNWFFAGTAGYGSFGSNRFGSEDQKFFATSLTWLPSNHKLGLIAKFVYSSECVESVGEYLQQGFGPQVGFAYRGQHLAVHLAGGVQYFDRYEDNRRMEASASAGLRYNFSLGGEK